MLPVAEGLMIAFDDASQTLSVSDGNGSNLLEIQVQAGLVTVKGQTKVVVEAPQIELVENALHPLIFGDALIQYLNQVVAMFNSHVHPGQMAATVPVTPAPPVPPFPTPMPNVLQSTKVKTG